MVELSPVKEAITKASITWNITTPVPSLNNDSLSTIAERRWGAPHSLNKASTLTGSVGANIAPSNNAKSIISGFASQTRYHTKTPITIILMMTPGTARMEVMRQIRLNEPQSNFEAPSNNSGGNIRNRITSAERIPSKLKSYSSLYFENKPRTKPAITKEMVYGIFSFRINNATVMATTNAARIGPRYTGGVALIVPTIQ